MVDSLELTREKKEAEKNKTPQSKSPRLCACGKKTLSLNCPYCPSCMSKKSRATKKSNGEFEVPLGEGITGYNEKIKESTATAAHPQMEHDLSLTINFDSYIQILGEVKRMAEMEMRPVNLQVIYMLKKYIEAIPHHSG